MSNSIDAKLKRLKDAIASSDRSRERKHELLNFVDRVGVSLLLLFDGWPILEPTTNWEIGERERFASELLQAVEELYDEKPTDFLGSVKLCFSEMSKSQRREVRRTVFVDPHKQALHECDTSFVFPSNGSHEVLKAMLEALPAQRKRKEIVRFLLKKLNTAPGELNEIVRFPTEKFPMRIDTKQLKRLLFAHGVSVHEDTITRFVEFAS